MKYSPSLPQDNDNVSHNNPFGEFVLLCAGLAALFLSVYWILGLLVDFAADRISYETETALFESISKHLEFQIDKDSEEQQRVQSLVNNLQNCIQLPYEIRVHMIESDEPNAIALPGGNIAVFTGLLEKIDSENGLAFVLSHELAHFKNRDHLRSLGRGLIIYTLVSMITSTDSSISSLLLPSSNLSQAQYSQTRESLADQVALDTLHCQYGHVGGASEFFSNLLEMKQGPDFAVFHYFSSHPELQLRISALRRYSEEQQYAFSALF